MIQAGRNITMIADALQKIQIEYLYNAIKNPKPDILNKINQLRIVRNIDSKQYGLLKKQLPYVVCGIFNPPIRRTENFAFCNYFILDIDHIAEKGFELTSLRQKIEEDNRVLLSFISPGEDGLKVLFRLNDRCYDAGIYSLFYKVFAADFSRQYGLEQVVDTRTSDVTRACFLSFDAHAYYNPQALPIDINAYLDTGNAHQMFSEKKHLENLEHENQTDADTPKQPKPDVDAEVMQRVKAILVKTPPKAEKPPAYVPEKLNEIISDLELFISETGVVVKEIINISYGKKIRTTVGVKEAEVNLFYGKRGFSVVQSPRTGTHAEMNQMLADLIEAFLVTR